ncbi:MAG: VTC domain-containing protein [Candidatus Aminicenantes bacterium]|jgi:hypothetical protein
MQDKNFRFERKFFISTLPEKQVINIIKMHPALFYEIYPPRYVNNIYLDTPGMKNYIDNVDGISKRMKIRIRWYNEHFGQIEKPTLEVKMKQGLLGRKNSYPLVPFTVDQKLSKEYLIEVFEKTDLPRDLKNHLCSMIPVLMNRYKRRYYLSADGGYRITLDSNLSYYRLNPYLNFYLYKLTDKHNVILELKYQYDRDDFADQVTNCFPFLLTRSSKYITGIDYLYF